MIRYTLAAKHDPPISNSPALGFAARLTTVSRPRVHVADSNHDMSRKNICSSSHRDGPGFHAGTKMRHHLWWLRFTDTDRVVLTRGTAAQTTPRG